MSLHKLQYALNVLEKFLFMTVSVILSVSIYFSAVSSSSFGKDLIQVCGFVCKLNGLSKEVTLKL
jgi:hypothetical protein